MIESWCKDIQYVRKYKKRRTSERIDLIPYYNGSNSKIYHNKKRDGFICEGSFKQISKRKIQVFLPALVWTETYKAKVLSKLRLKGKIKSYSSNHKLNKNIASFILEGKNIPKNLKTLGLIKKIPATNMVLISKSGVKKYDTVNDLLQAFCTMRYKKYEERKKTILPILKEELRLELLRYNYVSDVINDKIKIKKRKKDDVVRDMKKLGYPEEFLKMSMLSYTIEKLKELKSKGYKLEEKINYYEKSDPESIWLDELNDLKKKL